MIYVKINKGYDPISQVALYVAFEGGDLPRFQKEFEVHEYIHMYTTAVRGVFLPEKEGERAAVLT